MDCLDLFSGIGGISLGLRGLLEPVAYCDIDEKCVAVLRARIEDGSLRAAPIVRDVKTIDADSPAFYAESIAAGFPCQGFSGLGLRKGLTDDRSSLLSEVVRIVERSRPKLVFLENVPRILAVGMDHVVAELHVRLGYDLRWACVPASAVGAPHIRNRWFCLATVPGFARTWTELSYAPFVWTEEPVRHVERAPVELYSRLGLLGNSVVPDAVRLAFMYLVAGFRRTDLSARELAFADPDAAVVKELKPGRGWPMVGGVSSGGCRYAVRCPPFPLPRVALSIEGVPVPDGFVYNKAMRTPLVSTRMAKTGWPTPRNSCWHPCRVLTVRSAKDLPTVMRFETSTPPEHRSWKINPEFVEWMMGYEPGFTATTDERALRASGSCRTDDP